MSVFVSGLCMTVMRIVNELAYLPIDVVYLSFLLSVYHFVLPVCVRDHCKSDQPISFELGVMKSEELVDFRW